MTTFDLDIVHARDRENIVRLLSALEELEAVYRARPEQQLRPGESHPASPGHQLLLTKFGPQRSLRVLILSRPFHKFANVFKSPVELRSTVQAEARTHPIRERICEIMYLVAEVNVYRSLTITVRKPLLCWG